ncbi:DUF397 domain-containing protein [Streptomyces ziwulingensis]
MAVRDSKDPGDGPILRLGPDAWGRFMSSLSSLG